MKKNLTKIISILLLTLVVFVATTHEAHAQIVSTLASLYGLSITDFFNMLMAMFFNFGLKLMGLLLTLAGSLLNISILLTLNIKEFVDKSPAIYTTWRAIRDISGILFIFILLFNGIKKILGLKDAKYGEMLKNIVIAGVLVNFSFFLAGLGIDVSNIVSIQIFNAIAPTNSLALNAATAGGPITAESTIDGGISNIFMNSLKIPQLYKASNLAASADNFFKIVTVGTIGIIIEFAAAMSFAAAALSFIGRFAILIFLLAFSPIYFLSFLAPEIKTYADQWWKVYKNMLLFMPVYLLLMYLALSVLTTTPMFAGPTNSPISASAGTAGAPGGASIIESALAQAPPATAAAAAAATSWWKEYLLIAINATIVIFLLNLPLAAAASIVGKTMPILDKALAKFGAGNVWKNVGGYAGTRTVGRAASITDKALSNTRLGNTLIGRDIRAATTGALAGSKMGGGRSHDERVTAQKDVVQKGKELERGRALTGALAQAKASVTGSHVVLKKAVDAMSGKERLALMATSIVKDEAGAKELVKHLGASDFEAIKKSDDITDQNKVKISQMRKDALDDALTKGQTDVIKNMVESMDGKELLKLDPAILTEHGVVEHLKISQLKMMADEGISDTTKRSIGNMIDTWPPTPTPHKSYGFINKNRTEWT